MTLTMRPNAFLVITVCRNCYDKGGMKCRQCKEGFFLFNEHCYPCFEKFIHFNETCTKCDLEGCTGCKSSYFLNSGSCLLCSEAFNHCLSCIN